MSERRKTRARAKRQELQHEGRSECSKKKRVQTKQRQNTRRKSARSESRKKTAKAGISMLERKEQSESKQKSATASRARATKIERQSEENKASFDVWRYHLCLLQSRSFDVLSASRFLLSEYFMVIVLPMMNAGAFKILLSN